MERTGLTEYEANIRKEISNNLKRLLKEKRWTQKELAEKSGIPSSTISDYIVGRSLALPGNVQKLSFALGVDKDAIDPSFGHSKEEALANPKIKFFADLESELGIDLNDLEVQKMIKRVAKALFAKED